MEKYSDEEKKTFLLNLAKKYYKQGDDYYAIKVKKGNWHFGYSNDYPLQHGKGDNMILPDKMVNIIMNNYIA